MKNSGFSIKAGAFCILSIVGAAVLPTNVMAGDVTLKSADGTVNLTGEFLAFEDNSYMVRTPLGDLRIAATRVTCEGESCPVFEIDSADVQIAGSDTLGSGLVPLLLEGYAGNIQAAATISAGADNNIVAELIGDDGYGDNLGSYLVKSAGSNDAFSTLLENEAHIGMSSRRIRPDEARALRDAGAGNMVSPSQEHIVAVDSLVVITHPSNPIDTLTTEELGKIYSGEIKDWSEVGGNPGKILVVDRPEGSGTRAVFSNAIFGDKPELELAPLEVRIANDNSKVSEVVNEYENAIGFVGYAFQRGAKPLTLINECGLSIRADAFSARTEEYALQRRLYLYNRADADSEQMSDFLTYATSPAADAVISKSGFIGLSIDRRIQSLDSDRGRALLNTNVDAYEGAFMRDMLAKMVEYDRLSTTFRFRTGSSALDERGLVDMQRLADYLKAEPDAEVLFVGFTDDVGAFDSNRKLSEDRANQALAQFEQFLGDDIAGYTLDSAGYGEIAPSGCNVSSEGRRINRRVEVWVKTAG
ncbi:substrate-binding domain-containing protein [Rhodobacteraceae bacterium S2214]|nr:substrate-binding domain-containing protein [Rhodobacteraceae bacterium S2214]